MSEQRLSVTFGAFSCDVVGYDDPFSILNRVVELFGEIARSNPAFGAGEVGMSDMERAKLAAGLSDQASRIEEMADQAAPSGVRYVVSSAEADLLDAPADEVPTQDAPAEELVIEEPVVEDHVAFEDDVAVEEEVVIAAEAVADAMGGDLELRDTLEAADAPALISEEEVFALDIDPEPALPKETVAEALGLASPEEEPLIIGTTEEVAPIVAEATESLELVEETASIEINAIAEEPQVGLPSDEGLPEIADIETIVAAEAAEPAPEPKPLRLNISHAGVEPAADVDETPPAAEQAPAPVAEKPQRRVTVTKLPLRPEPKTPSEPIAVKPKHALTPVQKVEPVVTLNTTIADQSDEPAKPSRAERIKAKMEKRDAEDDGENFLFADVAEIKPEAAPEQTGKSDVQEPMLTLGDPAPVAPEAPAAEDETAKKPRRSFASLLGFGKKAADEPVAEADATVSEQVIDLPAPKAELGSVQLETASGFDRLRESVAAAMPATDEPLIASPKETVERPSISEAIDYDDETSPTTFARRVGATTLQDLLEVSAVYMDLVEGKSRFSRRDVMQALHQIDADSDYTQEARLKSFRKLLTTGSLVRVDDGLFTVSQATRYGYESQLQAS